MERRQVAGNEAFRAILGSMGQETELERDGEVILHEYEIGDCTRGLGDTGGGCVVNESE